MEPQSQPPQPASPPLAGGERAGSPFTAPDSLKDIPIELDIGYLCSTDLNPIDKTLYNNDLEAYLLTLAKDNVRPLLASLYSLPTRTSGSGLVALLPPPNAPLPRSRPLPKPRPQTRWEKFASLRGIQHKRRDKRLWDEEKQDWINRWGREGKNHELEDQWLTEVVANADAHHDPAQQSRQERRNRVNKNEQQRRANTESSSRRQAASRLTALDKTLVAVRSSTASMGRYDKIIDGDAKLRRLKRKFQPNEGAISEERAKSLAIASRLSETQPRKKEKANDVLNIRKAIRHASRGKGSQSLAKSGQKKSISDSRR